MITEKTKHDHCRGTDYKKSFWRHLKEHAIKTINYGNEEHEWDVNKKNCSIWKEEIKDTNDKNYLRVGDHCHYTGKYKDSAHSIWNFRYKIPKNNPVFFAIDETMIIILS